MIWIGKGINTSFLSIWPVKASIPIMEATGRFHTSARGSEKPVRIIWNCTQWFWWSPTFCPLLSWTSRMTNILSASSSRKSGSPWRTSTSQRSGFMWKETPFSTSTPRLKCCISAQSSQAMWKLRCTSSNLMRRVRGRTWRFLSIVYCSRQSWILITKNTQHRTNLFTSDLYYKSMKSTCCTSFNVTGLSSFSSMTCFFTTLIMTKLREMCWASTVGMASLVLISLVRIQSVIVESFKGYYKSKFPLWCLPWSMPLAKIAY